MTYLVQPVEPASRRSKRARRDGHTSTRGRFAIDRSTASRGYSKSSSFPAKYWSYAPRSKCPCPDRLKRITRDFPSASAFFASSTAALIACELSGAGMIPSERENVTAASKHARCGQATAMDPGRHEVVPESVHLHDGRHADGVAVVERVHTLGQRRAAGRLRREQAHLAAIHLVPHEGQRDPGEIAAPAVAGDHHVRMLAG